MLQNLEYSFSDQTWYSNVAKYLYFSSKKLKQLWIRKDYPIQFPGNGLGTESNKANEKTKKMHIENEVVKDGR